LTSVFDPLSGAMAPPCFSGVILLPLSVAC
jgi:hypothetical protein